MAGDNSTAGDPAVSSQTTATPDIAFMLTCTALVQLMTPGLAFFYAGLCRPTGACTMMAMSIVSLGIVTLLWFVFAFGMAFGPAWDPLNIVGSPFSYNFFNGLSEFQPLLMPGSTTAYGAPDLPGWLYAMYQNKFAVITPALASGAVADRFTLGPWAFFIVFWIILIYVPWCHAIWGGGYYAQQGVVDFAGGIVVHTTSGWSALCLAWVLGHREDKEERPHSVPLVVLGTALLWFGWFGFNAGSAYAADGVAVAAATNSMVAAASAMIGWKVLDRFVSRGKIGLIPMCVGAIAGLATITPAAGFVQPGAALVYGFLASLVCFGAIRVAKGLGVDDALDVWAVHGVGGSLGSILVAIFADGEECKSLDTAPSYCVNPGTVAASMSQLKKQTEATVFCAIYSMFVSYILIRVMSLFVKVGPTTSVADHELGETTYDIENETTGSMATPLLDSRAPEPTGGRWDVKPDGSKTWKPGVPAIMESAPPPPPPKVTTLQVAKTARATTSSEIMPIGSGDDRLAGLPQFGKIMAEYVWLGGAETTGGFDIRSKSRTFTKPPRSVSDLPIWNFDGSSTGQAPGNDSEVLLKPVAVYPDPFRGGSNIIVLCECLDPKLVPIPTNTRNAAAHAFARAYATEPWFGIEQEYTLFEKDGVTPLGWPVGGEPKEQGPYYCSAGYDVSFGRNVMECHYRCCLYAGLNISGTNAEVMPGQWEYQIGPCTGIDAGDQMWMSRYFMIRVCELLGVNVSFDPKPIPGDWNGAGCHTNYSTVSTRKAGGFKEIIKMVEKLGPKHFEHIEIYGEGNERRLTGKCETAAITDFSYGVANRGASIRIPRSAEQEGCGYFEDRRPASNCDPYLVTAKIFQTTVLDGEAVPQIGSQLATLVSPSQAGGQWQSKPDGSRVWSFLGAAADKFSCRRAPVTITTASGEVMPIGSGDARLKGLPQFGKIMAEYVWLGGAETTGGFDIRSKSRTLDQFPKSLSGFPIWNFDGSSTGQAPGNDSEVLLKPVAIYPDPFRGGLNVIVLCECLDPKMKPIPSNTRNAAAAAFAKNPAAEPWFGIEQEYTLFEKDGVTPLGWPVGGEPKEQGPYYCSAGYDVSFGRNVMECHYRCCLYAGLEISGTNAEVMPGQWEYQIGPCTGIASGDQMWMSRYFMIRVCELLGVNISFDPKPIPGDWNGAGCHTNFSTVATRKAGGFKDIIKMVEKLGPKHFEHIEIYGEGNERRLTGKCETAAITDFSYGVANRGASIRIPRSAEQEGCGYFEDRRPASNCDPYLVTAKIFQTTVLE